MRPHIHLLIKFLGSTIKVLNSSVKVLERNIKSGYYKRMLSTQLPDKNNKALEFVYDPFVLEFMVIKQNDGLLESDVYPKENLRLFREIIARGGLVVSEYIIGTKPEKYHFPARNRIISGLSKKVIVIEAGIKSGSLITVDFALEQGRDVYAVPGNILDTNSKGVNKLIKEGAKLLDCYEDLID